MPTHLRIATDIFTEHPHVMLGVVVAHGLDNTTDNAEIDALLRAEEAALPAKMGTGPVSGHPQIAPWREAYRKFGAKPKKYPSSIENLTKRVLKGHEVGHINNLVALYNVVSLRHILPVGGEDLAAIEGDVHLRVATDAEPAVRLLGEAEARPPYAREIIYADNIGSICRRWNWKEADRTKLTHATQNAVLVVEAIPPLTRAQLDAAVADLVGLIETYCGGTVTSTILDTNLRSVSLLP